MQRLPKHLASFLWDHRRDGRTDAEEASLSDTALAKPDWILFNGGVLESKQIRERLQHAFGSVVCWRRRNSRVVECWRFARRSAGHRGRARCCLFWAGTTWRRCSHRGQAGKVLLHHGFRVAAAARSVLFPAPPTLVTKYDLIPCPSC